MMAPHGQMLEALNRLELLIAHHRDELPDLYVSFFSNDRTVRIQVPQKMGTWTERQAVVDTLAQLCGTPTPHFHASHNGTHLWYQTTTTGWDIYTGCDLPKQD